MRKSTLLRTTVIRGYRPSIRLGKHGHPMRDPEGHDSGQQGNNSQGNSGDSNNSQSTPNNSGQPLDLAQFWQSSEGGETGAPRDGESAAPNSQSSGTQGNQGSQQETPNILQQIQALSLGNNVMTKEVTDQLAEGNPEGFHKAMNTMAQQTVESTVRLMVPLLRQMRDSMFEEMRGEMQGSFQSRENDSELVKAIPAAADPAVRPTVDSIFKRAMTLTKNDRAAAIQMTKDMLKLTTQKLEPDLGIPPRTPGDSGAQVPSNVNWLEELTGRS